MLLGIPRSASCVQRFDDSLNSAIHITYRISLRSSSMREPRDPLLKVVTLCWATQWSRHHSLESKGVCVDRFGTPSSRPASLHRRKCTGLWCVRSGGSPAARPLLGTGAGLPSLPRRYFNDPSAGSPTETLLRLLLPLNDQV
jgi:hypothetical protein